MIQNVDTNKVLSLLEKWTRAEICARLLPLGNCLEVSNYYEQKLAFESLIRKEVFGDDDLGRLGISFGILDERKSKQKEASVQVTSRPKLQQPQVERRKIHGFF